MADSSLTKYRKKQLREKLTTFIIENVVPDYIDYQSLEDMQSFIAASEEDQGEIGAFCDFFGLGPWFEETLAECDFSVDDFYADYAKEIEWRAQE
ncbi:hypothetical protein IKE71_01295 [Candidatus Saccharibacteria bacterium]|nr:hypothetical protein [Candidatus Saccharibacteria bacterium]